MPTYVYKREDGSTFEIEQRITADALDVCPTTGQAVRRIPSAGAGLVFKGSGFYLTDYARKGDPKGAGGSKDDGGGKEGGASPSASGDKAPASSPATSSAPAPASGASPAAGSAGASTSGTPGAT